MGDALIELAAEGISAHVDPAFGMIERLEVQDRGRTVSMLHRAPWRNAGETLPQGAAPHLAGLAGDFFCAPFGDASADHAPAHGWPANSAWDHLETHREGAATIGRFRLRRTVMGAELTKELRLIDHHPFLYQRHIFKGGEGTFAAANHAMVSLPHGGRMRFSPKRWWETPATPLESDPARGRSILAYPAKSNDPTGFPRRSGAHADLTRYPLEAAHEDFAVGVEAEGSLLGWTAVARPEEEDLFISLRDPKSLPVTMLWFSDGGRDYAPWNGRHTGVLGVEEGVNRALLGASAGETPHPLDAAGIPTGITLAPDRTVELRHVIGSVAWDDEVAGLDIGEGGVVVRGAVRSRPLPLDLDFLRLS